MLKKLILILFISFFVLFCKVNTTFAQACTAPATPSGVTVEYPGCNGDNCNFTEASCSWAAQADAASFNVTITEVETGTIVKNNEPQSSSTTKITFPITQGKTYKCDVVAVAACGSLSAAGSDQLLCEADAIIDTPTPTVAPTATPVPPTATPPPPVAGGTFQTIATISIVAFIVFGGVLLFVL